MAFPTRILKKSAEISKTCYHSLNLRLYKIFFYAVNREDDAKYGWSHYTLLKTWVIIALLALWLAPLIILNVWYGIYTTGCSSLWGRDWLGSFCADPQLNMIASQVPWFIDLWNAQDNTTHNVRLPVQDRNLVTGHYHICDAEQYFFYQLARIDQLPDDLRTDNLEKDLSKSSSIYL